MSHHGIDVDHVIYTKLFCFYPDEREGDGGGVQYRLGHVAVEVGAGRGEAGDVLGQAVVGVVQPAVQVGHAVVSLARHVASVSLFGQAAAES